MNVAISVNCLSGTVVAADGSGIAGVTIQADGQQLAVTDATGAYVIAGLSQGSHTVRPSPQDRQRYLFSPAKRTPVMSASGPLSHQDFTATPLSGAAGRRSTLDSGGAAGDSPRAEAVGCPPSDDAGGASAGTQMSAAHFSPSGWPTHHGGHGPNARFAGNEEADYSSSMRSQEAPRAESVTKIVTFYAWDHLGTVRLVMNAQGGLLSQHDFEPYGVELTTPSGEVFQFTGQERDTNTGFDYMHYRFYTSTMGRFMRPDNVSGSPLNPQDWNLYSYVHGNPVNFNDPTGHWASYGADRTEIRSTLWRENPVDAEGTDDWGGGGGAVGIAASDTVSIRLHNFLAILPDARPDRNTVVVADSGYKLTKEEIQHGQAASTGAAEMFAAGLEKKGYHVVPLNGADITQARIESVGAKLAGIIYVGHYFGGTLGFSLNGTAAGPFSGQFGTDNWDRPANLSKGDFVVLYGCGTAIAAHNLSRRYHGVQFIGKRDAIDYHWDASEQHYFPYNDDSYSKYLQ
ncbi:MAG: RHS repeat-associated core domain-containing protein [Acidobacteriota bacterium]